MADNLRTYAVVCNGGLIKNQDPLTLASSFSGSATRLINYEPALQGGYRKINGYENSYGTLPGTGSTLGVFVNGNINQGIFACRKPSSGYNYLHWFNHYYTVTVTSGTGTSFTVGETLTAVVSALDGTATPASGTVISKSTDTLVVNFGKLPIYVFEVDNIITGDTSSASSTVTAASVVIGWTAVTTVGTPTFDDVSLIRITDYNWFEEVLVLTDGVNPAAKYNGTTYTPITHPNAPSDPKYAVSFANHLFLAGSSAEPYNLSFSAPLDETDFDPANGAGVINVGFNIVQIKAFRDQLYVFGKKSIKKLTGTNIADFQLQEVTSDLGCIASDSVVEFGGDILFLGPDGIRPVSGTAKIGDVQLETVSREIQDIFELYTRNENLNNIRAVVLRKKSQFRLFFENTEALSILGGIRQSSAAQSTFEFSQLIGIGVTCVASGYVDQYEYVIHGDSNGKVHRQETGYSFDGGPIFSLFQTPYFYMDDPEIRKTFYSVRTYMLGEGSTEITVGINYNYGDSDILAPSNYLINTAGAASYYGVSTYDSTDIYDGNPTPIRKTNIGGSGDSISISYVTTNALPSHTIQALTITYGLADRR
jgi:hypothetical protein